MTLRASVYLFAALAFSTISCSTASLTKAPALKGRVFLITASGDLKPARLARVYVIQQAALDEKAITKEVEGLIYNCKRFAEEMPLMDRSVLVPFRSGVPKWFDNLAKLFNMAADNVSGFSTQADEEGFFDLNNLKHGENNVAVFGRAGVFFGYWRTTVISTQQAELKLSDPIAACPIP